mgnify:CR=1 FL=1
MSQHDLLSLLRHAAMCVDIAADDAPDAQRGRLRGAARALRQARDAIESVPMDDMPGLIPTRADDLGRLNAVLAHLRRSERTLRHCQLAILDELDARPARTAVLDAAHALADYAGQDAVTMGTALVPWRLLSSLRRASVAYQAQTQVRAA